MIAGQTPNLLKSETLIAALVLSALFWLLAWYWDAALAMISIWERSDTFAHGFLIVPVSGWLVWRKRHVLAALDLRPNFLALPLLAMVGFGWLLAGLGGVGVVQQFSLVIMIPLTAWAILGTEAVRALAFPLFFLVFAVPFGEFLEPPLMEHTADVLIALLKLTGIPVYREGQYFTIPSGSWSVVEACSGLRYLIASVTLGVSVRLSYLSQLCAACTLRRGFRHRSDRRELAARLHDRHDRPSEQHAIRGGSRPSDLRLAVFRSGHADSVLGRLLLARGSRYAPAATARHAPARPGSGLWPPAR